MPALLRVPSAVPGSLREALQICTAHLSMSFGEKADYASNFVYPDVMSSTTGRKISADAVRYPSAPLPELPGYPTTRLPAAGMVPGRLCTALKLPGAGSSPGKVTHARSSRNSVKTPNSFPMRTPPTIVRLEAIRSNLLLNELSPALVENDCR